MTGLNSEPASPRSAHALSQRLRNLSPGRLLLLVLVAGAVLRLVALDRWSLWTDEQYGLGLAPVYTLDNPAGPPDQHPPLYYLMMQQLIRVSTSEAWLRLPSALAGLVALLFIWKSGVAWQDRRFALLASALAAFSPLLIWYGREARMYGPAIGVWAASIYFYIQSFRRSSWLDAVGLAVSNIIGLYLVYPSLALWLGQMALFILLWDMHGRNPGRLVRWFLAQAATAIAFLLWWPYLTLQMNRSITFNWQLPFFDLSGTLAETFRRGLILAVVLLLIAMGISLLVTSRSSWQATFNRLAQPLSWLAFLGYLAILVLGTVPRGLSVRRQLLVFLIPLILAGAWGMRRLGRPWLQPAVVVIGLLLAVYTVASPPFEDWRGALEFVALQREEDELLFVYPWWRNASVDYYYPGGLETAEQIPIRDLVPGEDPFPQGSSVWVVMNDHPSDTDNSDRIWQRLDEMGVVELRRQFPRYIEVRRYVIR
jgi:uncharacterized membrane protein